MLHSRFLSLLTAAVCACAAMADSVCASNSGACSRSEPSKETVLLQTVRSAQKVDDFNAINASLGSPSNKDMEHFRLVNQARAQGGYCGGTYFYPISTPLQFDCRLWRAAQKWSRRMANEGFEGHTRGGSEPCGRTAAEGYPRGKGCGENLALGDASPSVAIQQFKDSVEHCRNMHDKSWNMIGTALVSKPGSRFRHYWTDAFGKYHRAPDQSCIGGQGAQSVSAACQDTDPNCAFYSRQGYCRTSQSVKDSCKDTCNLCR